MASSSTTVAEQPALRLVRDSDPPPSGPAGRVRAAGHLWLGLLWGEWFAHSRLVLSFMLLWLAAVWFLPLVAHPVWILGLGGLFAVIAGPAFGGSDVMGGCEEYAFSQPATRTERFDARLAVALFCLVAFTGMSAFALANHLADLVLSFFIRTGLAAVELRRPELLYGAVFAVPLAALAIGFSVAALATTRAVAYTAWVWAALGALTAFRAGLSLEDFFWDRLNGRITVPLLLAMAVITLGIGRRLYSEKEAGRASSPLRLPLSGWAALGAAALAALGVALLITWFIANFVRVL